jgi:hypothetical protein
VLCIRRLNLQAIEQQRKAEQRRKEEFDKLMEKTAGGDGPCHRLYKVSVVCSVV